jgi:hypothetical protein
MLRPQNLRFKKDWQEITLHDDLILEQYVIPKGTIVKTKETKNFGWIILPKSFPVKYLKYKH